MSRFFNLKSLILVLFIQSGILFAGHQPMGILKGVYQFADNLAEIPAYCLDRMADTPNAEATYLTFDSKVKITTSKGVEENTLDHFVNEGIVNVSGVSDEYGRGTHRKLKLEKGPNGDDLIQIEFLDHTVAREAGYNKYSQPYLKKAFERDIISRLAPEVLENPAHVRYVQQEYWDTQYNVFEYSGLKTEIDLKVKDYFEEHFNSLMNNKTIEKILPDELEIKSTPKNTPISFETVGSSISETHSIRKSGYNPEKNLTINYLHLEGGGNSFIVKTPAKELLIFDTGKVKFDAKRIKAFIKEYEGEIETVKMFVTHTDADHINGLKTWLKQGVEIEQIIVSNVERTGHGKEQLEKFRNIIADKKGYSEEYLADGELIRYGVEGKENDIHFKALCNDCEKVKTYQVNLTESSYQLIFHKYVNGSNVNDLSIVSKILHEDVSHLSMGDVGITAIKNLVNENKIQRGKLQERMDELALEIEELGDKIPEYIPSEEELISAIKTNSIKLSVDKLGDQFDIGPWSIYPKLAQLNLEFSLTQAEQKIRWDCLGIMSKDIENMTIAPEKMEKVVDEVVQSYNITISKLNETVTARNKLIEKYNELFLQRETLSLNSTVLQWPHHYWLPDISIASNKTTLDNLLNEVGPQYLVISKPPNGVKQDLEKLLDYLKGFQKEFDVSFEIKVLDTENFEITGELQKIKTGLEPFFNG